MDIEEKASYIGFLVLLLVFTLFVTVQSLSYEPNARQVPLLIAVPTLLLIVGKALYVAFEPQFWNESPEEPKAMSATDLDPADEEQFSNMQRQQTTPYGLKETARMAIWPTTFVVLIYLLGFLVAVPVFIFLFMRLYGNARWHLALGSAVGVTAVVYVVFLLILELELWSGIVFQ